MNKIRQWFGVLENFTRYLETQHDGLALFFFLFCAMVVFLVVLGVAFIFVLLPGWVFWVALIAAFGTGLYRVFKIFLKWKAENA